MRVILPRLAPEIDGGIPGIVRRRARPRALRPKAFVTGPGLEQRAIDGEVLVRQESVLARLRHDGVKEFGRDLAGEQSIAILRKGRVVPDRVVHPEAHEPPKQQVVIELLDEQPLTADAIERLQQQRAQQLLGRDRRATHLRVHRLEPLRQARQRGVGHLANRPKRVLSRHALLRRHVAKQEVRSLVSSSHRGAALLKVARSLVRP
jgi:hypothetical protein